MPFDYVPPEDFDAELAEVEWAYQRRRRRQRNRAIVAAIVAITLILLTVLPYFVRTLRGRSTPTTTIPVVQVLDD